MSNIVGVKTVPRSRLMYPLPISARGDEWKPCRGARYGIALSCFGLSQRRPVSQPPHFQKISAYRKKPLLRSDERPQSGSSPGGNRDDLVDTPSLRGSRLVRDGGFLRRLRLGRSFRASLFDGKSQHRREHHAVCGTKRSGQQLRPGRATLWPGRPHGAVWRSTRPIDALQSFHRLRLQRHAS